MARKSPKRIEFEEFKKKVKEYFEELRKKGYIGIADEYFLDKIKKLDKNFSSKRFERLKDNFTSFKFEVDSLLNLRRNLSKILDIDTDQIHFATPFRTYGFEDFEDKKELEKIIKDKKEDLIVTTDFAGYRRPKAEEFYKKEGKDLILIKRFYPYNSLSHNSGGYSEFKLSEKSVEKYKNAFLLDTFSWDYSKYGKFKGGKTFIVIYDNKSKDFNIKRSNAKILKGIVIDLEEVKVDKDPKKLIEEIKRQKKKKILSKI